MFPGGPHRPYGATCKVSADLVVQDVGKSTFLHFPVNWHFKVIEMASKTLHIVEGLSRTPLLFIPRYLTNIFFENMSPIFFSIIENLKIRNFKNPGSLTSAQLLTSVGVELILSAIWDHFGCNLGGREWWIAHHNRFGVGGAVHNMKKLGTC